VEKFKMRSMCFSFASVLKCASCAWDTETFLKECLRLCVRLLLRALNLFLSWLFITVSLILRSINGFLNQDSYRLLKYVSDLVSIFDTGWFCFTSQLPSARVSDCGHPCNPLVTPCRTQFQTPKIVLLMKSGTANIKNRNIFTRGVEVHNLGL